LPPFAQVDDLRRVVRRLVERRLRNVLVGDRDPETGSELAEFVVVELLLLVGDVAPFPRLAQAVALDGAGEDDGGRSGVVHGRPERGVDLRRVVASQAKAAELLVGICRRPCRPAAGSARKNPGEWIIAVGHEYFWYWPSGTSPSV
jgi:hypothetical protein